jgi:molybdate transport system substrate-binding protein
MHRFRVSVLVGLSLAIVIAGCAAPPARNTGTPVGSNVSAASPVASGSPAISAPSAGAPVSGEITVFAASSLTDAFNEIGERFKAGNPNASVTFNFGASTQLFTQLDQGARADVFASADQVQMDRAKSAGRIAGADTVFATNRLVIVTPSNNPGGVRGAADLTRPGLRLVTTQPDVPIGAYTQAMLDRMSQNAQYGAGFKDRVNANIVSREANVRQIVSKVQLGEADAGVVYKSDITPQAASQLATFDIPDEFNALASYPIAAVRDGANQPGAAAFIAFVLAPEGQAILEKWNFVRVRG